MTDLLIALLLAVIVAPFVPFFWSMFVPLAPATVSVGIPVKANIDSGGKANGIPELR
jgi:hypothetical protein